MNIVRFISSFGIPFCLAAAPGAFAADYTILAPTGGSCGSIGLWNAQASTCTLTQDVSGSIEIASDGVKLDGNGHLLNGYWGPNNACGVLVSNRTRVAVQNLAVRSWRRGIYAVDSSRITLQQNSLGANDDYSIVLESCTRSSLYHNTVGSGNSGGILLYDCSSVTLNNNATDRCVEGITLMNSTGNTLKGNRTSQSYLDGIRLVSSGGNTLKENVSELNGQFGFSDDSTGPGPSGTGNRYINNECQLNGGGSNPDGLCNPP